MWEIFTKSLRKIQKNLLARFLSRRHVNYMQDFGQKISLADEIIPQLASLAQLVKLKYIQSRNPKVWGLDPLQCQWLLFITILS